MCQCPGKGFAADSFNIDWDAQRVTCPVGVESSGWTPARDNRSTAVIKVKFSAKDCNSCVHRIDCAGPKATRRLMTLRMQAEYIALKAARQRQQTSDFRNLYAIRAEVEATMSQAVRGFGLRRTRYFGHAKTHLQHVATAAAMNLVRLVHWINGAPLVSTRRSHFSRLIHTKPGPDFASSVRTASELLFHAYPQPDPCNTPNAPASDQTAPTDFEDDPTSISPTVFKYLENL